MVNARFVAFVTVTTVFIAFLTNTFDLHAAGKISEEDLVALEYKNGGNPDSVPFTTKDEALFRYPVLAYSVAFDEELKQVASRDPSVKNETLLDGLETPMRVALAPAFVAGGFNTTTGAIGSTAAIVVAAGVGLNLINSLFGADLLGSNKIAKFRKGEIASMRTPSLYLTKITKGTKGDDELKVLQASAYQLVRSLPFGCEPAINRFEQDSVGHATENRTHARIFTCGFEADEKGDQDLAWNDMRVVFSSRIETTPSDPTGAISIIKISNLEKMKYPRMLGIPEVDNSQKNTLGRIAYEKAKDAIPPDWTAVYPGPNAKGEWAVFVARNGVTIEFPMIQK